MQGDLSRPLSVLTWNVSYEPLQPLGVLPWEQRRERIADAVRDADIIAIRELSGRQLHDMEESLAGFEVVTLRIPLPEEASPRPEHSIPGSFGARDRGARTVRPDHTARDHRGTASMVIPDAAGALVNRLGKRRGPDSCSGASCATAASGPVSSSQPPTWT
jgi:hypothetical protein